MNPPDAPPPAARGRSRWSWLALVAGALGVVACAVAPMRSRADLPAASSHRDPGLRQVAREIEVQTPTGRLDLAQRQQLLKRLGAEGQASALQRHLSAAAQLSSQPLLAGNQAKLLVDGPATFASMFQAIDQARHSVLLESYIVEDADVTRRLVDQLIAKRQAGLQVGVIYDAVGSIGTPQALFDRLRAAGVSVCQFNPVHPFERAGYWDISHRDHRKVLAVDRAVAFTGGINISAVYASGSFGSGRAKQRPVDLDEGWRDTHVRLQGPAADRLDALVRQNWHRQGCPALPGEAPPAPPSARQGDDVVRILPSSPDDPQDNAIYSTLLTAIDASRESIQLTMAYFAPGEDMVAALCEAAQRGVKVQLVLPSVSDFKPVLYAGRSHYTRLLAAGVEVHELESSVLHAKTAVIDRVVSTIGSSNMDWRSFAANDEVNAMLYGEDFGSDMARLFQADLSRARAITREQWADRPYAERGKEWLARLFERFW